MPPESKRTAYCPIVPKNKNHPVSGVLAGQ
uniref:Uncharacterized protein n=1 Tax=Myoviridae sp. ct2AC8 TaxID=2827655 RepID=A0A8S5TPV8_9CAUD|nr:MAG TPA: hypothetical protein [Myoviridae sp. ct2AC8]